MRMGHFSSEQWTDFVRKTLKTKDMLEMQSHLETGCQQCKSDYAVWNRVTNVASRERGFEPSVSAVKMAKAAMALHGRPSRIPIAKLLFDSLSAPALAGVRSSSGAAHQMLYGFDDYRVDLRFEPNLDSEQALLVGQVLHPSAGQALGKIAVSVIRGGQTLGAAETNEFGEFQLECDLGSRIELQLTLPDGALVRVPMIEPIATAAGPQSVGNKKVTPRRKMPGRSTRKKV